MEQFFSIVDREQTEVRWQSEWFGGFKLENALDLAGRFTLAQMLAHETFRKRYEAGQALTILELMYPMLQAYDSVAINADVEFGGTDQKFNNLAGRELMTQMGMQPQHVLLVPLIPGTDGRKMGKSFDNTIDIRLAPFEMYSKVMSMSDDMLPLYFEVLSNVSLAELNEIKQTLAAGSVNPMELKKRLAHDIVAQFYTPDDATEAGNRFSRQFGRSAEIPDDIPQHTLSEATSIIDLMVAADLAKSKGEARRLIDGGGVRIGGEKVNSYDLVFEPGSEAVVQVGRRKFVRVQ
jgi:tyrosyl-tRNA synthetase